MATLSVLKRTVPIVTISFDPLIGKQNYSTDISTNFITQPEGNTTSLPSVIATSAPGTTADPAIGGSAPAAGSNVTSGGAVPSGSFGTNSFDPTTARVWPQQSGVPIQLGFTFKITTTFCPGMPSTGATAVLFSDSGTPPWAGTSVPLNGFFTLDPATFTNGDVVRVKVTPAAPSATLIGYSNEIPFTSVSTAIKRVGKTHAFQNTCSAVTGTTNYIWWVSNFPGGSNIQKLYRMDKSTEVVVQAVNIRGDTISDGANILGVVSDVVFFTANNSSGVSKLYFVTEALVVTQAGNTSGNATISDLPATIPWVDTSFALRNNSTIVFNNFLYYSANNSSTVRKIFKVSSAGVVTQVSNTAGSQGTADYSSGSIAAVWNGAIYITLARGAAGISKLCKISTADVITQIGDTRNASATSDGASIKRVTTNFLYYTSANSSGFSKLYRINTSDTPAAVVNFNNNAGVSDVYGTGSNHQMASFNECLYFVGRTINTTTDKIYKVDDAGTVSNIASPLFRDGLVEVSSVWNFILQSTGNALFFGHWGADGMMTLFYVTSSDVVTRANVVAINLYDNLPFVGFNGTGPGLGAFTANGRTFLGTWALVENSNTSTSVTTYEVLPTTFNLRCISQCSWTNGAQWVYTGHTTGSICYLPFAASNGHSFPVKLSL
jgi:hypothetical protein